MQAATCEFHIAEVAKIQVVGTPKQQKHSVRIPLKKTNTCKHRKYTYTSQILVGTPTKIVEIPASENAGTSFFRLHLTPPRNQEPYNRM